MSEEKAKLPTTAEDPFDPSSFISSSPLGGQRGIIREALVVKHNFGGTTSKEVTCIRVVVHAAHLAKPRENLYSLGDSAEPSEDGVSPSIAGPLVVGAIKKQSNGDLFLSALKASGFPMQNLAKPKGVEGLINAEFTWAAKDRSWTDRNTKEKVVSTYDVPAHFEGYEGEQEQTSAAVVELTSKLQAAIVQALEIQPEIPRGQLSLKVAELLKTMAPAERAQALALISNDKVLGSIPGVTYDKKTVKKA